MRRITLEKCRLERLTHSISGSLKKNDSTDWLRTQKQASIDFSFLLFSEHGICVSPLLASEYDSVRQNNVLHIDGTKELPAAVETKLDVWYQQEKKVYICRTKKSPCN